MPRDLDVLADAKGLVKMMLSPATTLLSTPWARDPQPGHADAGHERGDLEAELVERDHHGEEQHHDPDGPDDQLPHRRLERPALEWALGQVAGPPGDEEPDAEKHHGAEHLESVPDHEIKDQLLRGHGDLLTVTSS
jgi:hypothetical protein